VIARTFFATEHGVAITDLSDADLVSKEQVCRNCVLHQTPIEDTALLAPGAISPHLEEHSYPHAGQSKDGLFSSNEESSYKGGSGAEQHL